jgi:hypothetical protein
MDRATAQELAEGWVQAWNAHDVGRVLDQVADDVAFTSPAAARLAGRRHALLNPAVEVRAKDRPAWCRSSAPPFV